MEQQTIAETIYLSRHRKRISQAVLAIAAGCSRNYISLIERGEVEPSIEILRKIAAALGLALNVTITAPAADAQGEA